MNLIASTARRARSDRERPNVAAPIEALSTPPGAAPGASVEPWITAALALLLFLTLDLAKEHVSQWPRFRVDPWAVKVSAPMSAAQSALDDLIAGGPYLGEPRSIFDPALEAEVRGRLEARPWVRQVGGFSRAFPARIQVALDLRKPLGVFRVGGERLLVDREGVVIERDTSFAPPQVPWIRTPGDPVAFVPRVGAAFREGSAVQEALGVLEELAELQDHPSLATSRIMEIQVGVGEVRRTPGASDLSLILDSGLRLLWGRSPRSAFGRVERPAADKLEAFSRVQRRYVGLIGVSLVDLRFSQPEVVLTDH